jgi:hypothetical protein
VCYVETSEVKRPVWFTCAARFGGRVTDNYHNSGYYPKHVVILKHIITSIEFSVAIAGIHLKDSYVYITQHDAPHKD